MAAVNLLQEKNDAGVSSRDKLSQRKSPENKVPTKKTYCESSDDDYKYYKMTLRHEKNM